VAEVIDDLTVDLRRVAEDARVTLAAEPFEACAVTCSPGVLASLAANLVRNGIKYIGDGPERRIPVRVLPGVVAENSVRVSFGSHGYVGSQVTSSPVSCRGPLVSMVEPPNTGSSTTSPSSRPWIPRGSGASPARDRWQRVAL
jgi:hypothetical protein